MAKPISFILSILVTLTLIAAMYALIKMKDPELNKAEGFKLPNFTYVAKNEDVQTITPKPNRPDEVQEQPEVPDTKIVPDRVDINSELGLGAVKIGINRDLKGFNSNDGEFLPIFRAPAHLSSSSIRAWNMWLGRIVLYRNLCWNSRRRNYGKKLVKYV